MLWAARLAVARGADAVVVPCNTASVTALVPLRAELEPRRPVVGTVPAVKPAATSGDPFGIWATERTSASAYQADLVALFATPGQATPVPCPGLADAVEAADPGALAAAVAVGASRTPADAQGIVLGCTHYPLVSDAIAAALPGVRLYDSSRAVAGQALRRLGLDPAPDADPAGISVMLSGDEGDLPADGARLPGRGGARRGGPRSTPALLPPPVRDDALAEDRLHARRHPALNAAPYARRGDRPDPRVPTSPRRRSPSPPSCSRRAASGPASARERRRLVRTHRRRRALALGHRLVHGARHLPPATPWNTDDADDPKAVKSPDVPGRTAVAYTVPGGGTRSELEPAYRFFREGDEYWFGLALYLPEDSPPTPTDWQVVAQWKNLGDGSPPFSVQVHGGRFVARGRRGDRQALAA